MRLERTMRLRLTYVSLLAVLAFPYALNELDTFGGTISTFGRLPSQRCVVNFRYKYTAFLCLLTFWENSAVHSTDYSIVPSVEGAQVVRVDSRGDD